MKILFSADWHIKIGQKNVPRDWQINRYEMLFEKLHKLEEQVDLHIVGGDIFDKVPNPEELALYFNYVSGCACETIIYDGNHEATRKGKTFLKFLAHSTNSINSKVYVIDGIYKKYSIDFIPYTHLKTFNPNDFHNEILCTHVRGSIPPHVVPEIELEKFARWKTVLAGDLHAYENSQLNILYPGSPLSITFHRNPVNNGVIIFDTGNHTHEWINLGLPQLIRKTVESKDEIIKTDYDHTIYEIQGDILSLSGVDTSSDLIDKKIISKKSDTILDLKNLSIEEELELYFRTILKIGDEESRETLKVFNDYYK